MGRVPKFMPNVHILSPEVISKIAAGEVIERPASVIKELVENSLDADASRIEVRIEDAGKKLIEVQDDGQGIDADDLGTVFHRHATSKISAAEDLHAIRSLGFRGEALYSVAAISHITLRSKTERQDTGMEIQLRGGEVMHTRPCGFSGRGTVITIEELFFNTPARKKFLKSNTTELHQILSTFIPYALLHHDIRFRLSDGQLGTRPTGRVPYLDAVPAAGRVQRFAAVLNLDARHLQEVRHAVPGQDMSVELILGDINIRRTRRDMQFIFVNGRPVQNKAVSFHLNQVYRLILPPEISPCFAVFLTVGAGDVDVNIHPTKHEVKLKNERDICAAVRSLSEQALMTGGQIKAAAAGVQITRASAVDRALAHTHPSLQTFDADTLTGTRESPAAAGDYAYPRVTWEANEKQDFFIPENTLFEQNRAGLHNRLREARYIGNAVNKFLLFEVDRSVLVIDQHAAAERVTYERLIRQMEKGAVEVQYLLTPVLMKMTPQELIVWENAKDKFEELGLSASMWDSETLAVHAHPVFLKDIENAVRYLLGGDDIAACGHDALARRACRSSVMAGDKLSPPQAEHVRQQLLECLDPFTCPHGRPTVIELTEDFLDKQFLRT